MNNLSSLSSFKVLLCICAFFCCGDAIAQDDLLEELEATQAKDTDITMQTFKGTRLVNGHSVETKSRGDLEFIFAHRFGAVNQGLYELFGLDDAYVRVGLDYGVSDDFSASIGRNSVDKSLDGYIKYKIARQRSGSTMFPLTITGLGGIVYKASPRKADLPEGFKEVDRLAYVGQLLIARKFTRRISFQVMPTFIHKNAVDKSSENNDQLALGVGSRLLITKGVALTGEYYPRLNVHDADEYANTLGFGIDIETGGHVFQLVMTSTRGLTERAFITESEGDFFDGDIHFGFNVTRTFHLSAKK